MSEAVRLLFCFLSHTCFYEAEGKEVFHAVYHVDTLGAIEQNADGLLVAIFDFEYHLTTGATWRHRNLEESILVASSYGECCHRLVGLIGLRSKDCCTLGTKT